MNTAKGPIRYGKQDITDQDIDAVVSVLKSDMITQGPKVREFEEEFAAYVGAKYAVAVSNGTAALHVSNMTLGVDSNTRVITTPITFVATANSVKFCGGEVYFADIDPNTYLLDINKVRELLQQHPKGYFSGIIPVDFAGRAVDMEKFRALADEYDLWIIEDACHAPGGYFTDSKGAKQNCGNGEFADLSIFSFHPVKHIACGEGGMVTTNNEELYKKLFKYRSHGITSDPSELQNDPSEAFGFDVHNNQEKKYPGWYMEMQNLGFNYRVTDIQSALGVSQLKRAKKGLEKRRNIASTYNVELGGESFIKGHSKLIEGHAYHLYVIEVDDRLGLYNHLKRHNIYSQIHYFPAHLMPYYKELGYKLGDFPFAENFYQNCLSIPMYPTLLVEEQSFVLSKISEYYKEKL